TEERIRKAAAKSSGPLERKRNSNRGFYDEVASAFSRKIQNRGLTREKTTLGSANQGGEAAVAPGLNALVAEVYFLRAAAPGRGSGPILGTACLFLCATRATAFTTSRRRCGD